MVVINVGFERKVLNAMAQQGASWVGRREGRKERGEKRKIIKNKMAQQEESWRGRRKGRREWREKRNIVKILIYLCVLPEEE